MATTTQKRHCRSQISKYQHKLDEHPKATKQQRGIWKSLVARYKRQLEAIRKRKSLKR